MLRHFTYRTWSASSHSRQVSRVPSLVLVALFCMTLQAPAHATTYTVCSSGCDYTSINAAVSDHLRPGNTIQVNAGTYREGVAITGSMSGSSGSRAVLQAIGNVIIDGSDPHNTTGEWTLYSGNVYSAAVAVMSPPASQVYVDDVRYAYVPGPSYGNLASGEYGYDSDAGRVYVNVGGGNPGSHETYVGNHNRQYGIDADRASYLTIDGFTVLRFDAQGIRIRGASSVSRATSNIVQHCSSAYNWSQGIHFRYLTKSTITKKTTYCNPSHGIYLLTSDNCFVSGCASYNNEGPTAAREGVTGIKVGDTGDSLDVTDVAVDYNVTHNNEDSGIDLKGASRVAVRRNLSYSNGDHGYDNNETNHTIFINDIAFRNDHDGISIENTSKNVGMFNCALVHNGVNGATLGNAGNVRQLAVLGATGFKSDNNVIVGLRPGVVTSYWSRYAVEFPAGVVFNNFEDYYVAGSLLDGHSYGTVPLFADTTVFDFRVNFGSDNVVDAGRTNMAGWLSPMWLSADPRGFVAHDCADVFNDGAGSPNYVDIGLYELNPPPSGSDLSLSTGANLMGVSWTAPGADGTVGTATAYDLRYRTDEPVTEANFSNSYRVLTSAPHASGTTEVYIVSGLGSCAVNYFGLKTQDELSTNWSVLRAAQGSTQCGGSGGGGGGGCQFCEELPPFARPAEGYVVTHEEVGRLGDLRGAITLTHVGTTAVRLDSLALVDVAHGPESMAVVRSGEILLGEREQATEVRGSGGVDKQSVNG